MFSSRANSSQIGSHVGRGRHWIRPVPAGRAAHGGEGVAADVLRDHLPPVRTLDVDLNRRLGRVGPFLVDLVEMPVVDEGALQHTALRLGDVVGPAERGDKPVDQLIHRGRRPGDRSGDAPFLVVIGNERVGFRASPMTGIAGDDVAPRELGFVDVSHHRHHAPRHFFHGLRVQVTALVVVVVAVHAVNAERNLHELHGRLHQVGRHAVQHFDVLVELLRRLSRRLRGGRLGPDPADDESKNERGPDDSRTPLALTSGASAPPFLYGRKRQVPAAHLRGGAIAGTADMCESLEYPREWSNPTPLTRDRQQIPGVWGGEGAVSRPVRLRTGRKSERRRQLRRVQLDVSSRRHELRRGAGR